MSQNEKRIIDASLDEVKDYILEDIRAELKELSKKLMPKPKVKWISRKEAKEKLSVSFVTLHKWNKTGVLKSHKIGGAVRYKESDINEKLENN